MFAHCGRCCCCSLKDNAAALRRALGSKMTASYCLPGIYILYQIRSITADPRACPSVCSLHMPCLYISTIFVGWIVTICISTAVLYLAFRSIYIYRTCHERTLSLTVVTCVFGMIRTVPKVKYPNILFLLVAPFLSLLRK